MIINDTVVISPQHLNERFIDVRADNVSLNGTMQRNQLNRKKVIVATWERLTPTEFQQLDGLFGSGQPVIYANPDGRYGATFEFRGLPTILDDGEYEQGGSFIIEKYSVQIREI